MSTLSTEAGWPKQDELVVAQVDEIVDHGVYVKLENYPGKRGYLPISEISQGWVTDIKRFVNIGQRVVLRVIRVNPTKGHIDLSLKRVTLQERNTVLKSWKRRRKFLKTIEEFFSSYKIPQEKRNALLEKFLSLTDPLSILERAASEGSSVLQSLNLEEDLINKLTEYSKKALRIKQYTKTIRFTLSTTQKGGADKIKNVLKNIEETLKTLQVEGKVYVVAAPKYAIEIISTKPKVINNIAKELLERIRKMANELTLDFKVEENSL
ncbi:hypothetical protein B9Q01_00925 [Candidatus Marsarchaeota G1 archaeon OSP_D]|jgi:translation initiation factor 2 subunit 1|uniref:S1 motif domain-containing protein n=3 Tax=Candidatus Marsarchaeota group 1 TaxID=2203770 RepID=A0A2R6AGY8_9ARCH|nr:MAG: hypothetical protein B9Q01_00925 [Candidatus Marsarchaeota G1 archaeon OSP_D]PSN85635.1 MAG: hypothetical protein B9Q02_05495 [Candidatus Marsarchaeota G1 archaeon BE_D]PSN89142.1 MAG: hypothetical protein B9Q00_02680 [Candidatus Marsarchaeota G1 archaeon OSP_C]